MDRITSFPWDFVLIGKMLGTLSHWEHSMTEKNSPPVQNGIRPKVPRGQFATRFWTISFQNFHSNLKTCTNTIPSVITFGLMLLGFSDSSSSSSKNLFSLFFYGLNHLKNFINFLQKFTFECPSFRSSFPSSGSSSPLKSVSLSLSLLLCFLFANSNSKMGSLLNNRSYWS